MTLPTTPSLDPPAVACFIVPHPDRPSDAEAGRERFTALLAATWPRIPADVRRTLTDHWRRSWHDGWKAGK